MRLVSDFTDYYDKIFDGEGPEFHRIRGEALNKWQALDYMHNSLQENIPEYGLPDSLIEDGFPMETLVYAYPSIFKQPTALFKLKTKKVLCTLKEALESYRNKLCVKYVSEYCLDKVNTSCKLGLSLGHRKLLKIGKYFTWLKYTEGKLTEILPFVQIPGNYMHQYPICLLDVINEIAVDFDSCPVLDEIFKGDEDLTHPLRVGCDEIEKYLKKYFQCTKKAEQIEQVESHAV